MGKFLFDLYSKIPVTTKLLEFPNSSTIYSLLSNQGQVVSDEEAWKIPECVYESIVDHKKSSLSLLSVKHAVIFGLLTIVY